MELKACPFCGYNQDDFAGMYEESFSKCSDGTFSICCSECDCTGARAWTLKDAVKAWNTRKGET
jgi:Lar family restriction alleviation protein